MQIMKKRKKKVEERGGFVFEKKSHQHTRYLVQGTLEVTRSVGDRMYKKYITCEPDILEYDFNTDDEYLLIGSDGFWNEITEQEVVEFIKAYGKTEGLSTALVEQITKQKKYSLDNITLIVIDLKQLFKYREILE